MFTTHEKYIETPPKELFRKDYHQWRRCYIELNLPWFIVDLGLNWGAYFQRLGGYQVIVSSISDLHEVILENKYNSIVVQAVIPRINKGGEGLRVMLLKEIWELYRFDGEQKSYYETVFVGDDNKKYSYQMQTEYINDNPLKDVIVV